jgi:hypothetical protein
VRAAGFTHPLISWSELERLGGPDYRVMRFEDPRAAGRWRSFLSSCTSAVWREGALEIWALRVGCSAVPARFGEAPEHYGAPEPLGRTRENVSGLEFE